MVPEGVHQVDGGRARVAGPGERADDPLSRQRTPQALVAHVALDHVRDRGVEDDLERLGVAGQQLLDLGALGRVADPRVPPAVAQRTADPAEERAVGEVAVDVAWGECVDGGSAPVVVVPQGDRRAVLEGAPQVGVDDLDPVPVPAQAELVDHQRVEQPDQIGARAHHEPVVLERALERARTPETCPALEHEHGEPAAGQVGGGGQPVVAATDHHDVPVPGGHVGHRHGQADLAEDVEGAHDQQVPTSRRPSALRSPLSALRSPLSAHHPSALRPSALRSPPVGSPPVRSPLTARRLSAHRGRMALSQGPDRSDHHHARRKGMTMVDFWTSIPLMALAALVSMGLLLGLSVADQRRTEPVPLRLERRRVLRRPPAASRPAG